MPIRILYYDSFERNNSNFFWKASFEKLGSVFIADCNPLRLNPPTALKYLTNLVKSFNPTHLHLGGSVKNEKYIPIDILKQFRSENKELNRVTWFYGDAYNNSKVQMDRIDYVDNIYITNKSHLTTPKAKTVLCPYNNDVYKPFNNIKKQHDLVFVGNPHNKVRVKEIESLSKKFDLHVYGDNRWKEYNVNYKGALRHNAFSQILSKYKIALGDPAPVPCKWIDLKEEKRSCHNKLPLFSSPVCTRTDCSGYAGLEGYFSNRIVNVMASGVFHLTSYVDGAEIFEDKKDLAFYNDNDERDSLIVYYLKNDDKREKIALNGYDKVKTYTFDNLARKIIYGN